MAVNSPSLRAEFVELRRQVREGTRPAWPAEMTKCELPVPIRPFQRHRLRNVRQDRSRVHPLKCVRASKPIQACSAQSEMPHLMVLPSLAPTRTTNVARNAVRGPSAPASQPIGRLLPPSPWESPATAARPRPLIGPGPAAPEAAGPRSPLWRLANGDALARRAPSDTLPVPPAWAVTWQHRHWSTPPHPFSHPESSQAAAPQRYVRSGPGTHYRRANGARCTQSTSQAAECAGTASASQGSTSNTVSRAH